MTDLTWLDFTDVALVTHSVVSEGAYEDEEDKEDPEDEEDKEDLKRKKVKKMSKTQPGTLGHFISEKVPQTIWARV